MSKEVTRIPGDGFFWSPLPFTFSPGCHIGQAGSDIVEDNLDFSVPPPSST